MVSLGGFILFFGFLAFNGGSQASIAGDGDAAVVALAIVNTILSGTYMYVTCLVTCDQAFRRGGGGGGRGGGARGYKNVIQGALKVKTIALGTLTKYRNTKFQLIFPLIQTTLKFCILA